MKKLFALMFCAALLATCALAETPEEAPEKDKLQGPVEEYTPRAEDMDAESITLSLNGEDIVLPFDDSPQYSTIESGMVQASFYTYSEDGNTLYELYIVFPDSVRSGDVITPQNASQSGDESSVVLIVSDVRDEREDYYFSSVMIGGVYPENSDFSIQIDSVESTKGTTAFAGRLSAELVSLDMATGEPSASLSIPEAPFYFVIGETTQVRHDTPMPTGMPGDMRKV